MISFHYYFTCKKKKKKHYGIPYSFKPSDHLTLMSITETVDFTALGKVTESGELTSFK